MSSNQVNISNLRTYINTIIQNQAKNTQPAYANQFNLVSNVSNTAKYMDINPKTGTISVTTSTGTILVPQPVINPIVVNSPNSFISTYNNEVISTSKDKHEY